MIPILLGLGVNELSVASRNIVQVRDLIRSSLVTESFQKVEKILSELHA